MHKKSYPVHELQRRLEESGRDKAQLKKSIQQLNECYESKINILQNTVQAYENRLEQLLEWKKNYIDRQLQITAKYEEQNKKLLEMIGGLESTFNQEKNKMQEELKQKDRIISQYVQEREELISKSQQGEQKIDQLVREHTRQIQQLKNQLLLLKQQEPEGNSQYLYNSKQNIVESQLQTTQNESQNQNQKENPLRQITNNNILKTAQETRIKQITYRSPFVQFATH